MNWDGLTVFGDVVRAAVAAGPDKTAIISGGQALSFAAVNARMNRVAHALQALGLGRGERVAVLTRNRPEAFEIYGAAKAALAVLPLNWRLAPDELLHPLMDGEPAAVVAEPCFAPQLETLRSQAPFVRHWLLLDEDRAGWLSYESLLRAASDGEPDRPVAPDDLLCLMYTSGTTGKPKGAMLTHQGLMRNCRAAVDWMLALRPDDVALAVMPLFHVGGLWYHLFPAFARGCTSVLLPEFNPAHVLAALEGHGVTYAHVVPTMLSALVNHPDVGRHDLSRMRVVYYAASTIPVELLRRAMATFPHCDFMQGYGSTEGGMITALTAQDHRDAASRDGASGRLATCGRALHCALRIIDPDDSGIGEIAVHSDRTMAGYWHNPDATAAVMGDGWFRTGDLGSLDAEGYLTIADRKHDMIVSGGENIYPRDVEDALAADPAILEAAVFGLPDPHWVEKVAAAVVLRPGSEATTQDLIAHARQHLAGYKVPKTIFLCDSLPKSGAGKVLKKLLRQQFAGQ